MLEKLGLGTAQFGSQYGIANRVGQIGRKEAKSLITLAEANGLDMLDSAMAYGDSEQRLGEIGVSKWQIVSKLPALPQHEHDVEGWVVESVKASLLRLRVSSLYGLLLHRPSDLLEDRGHELYQALTKVRDLGLVDRIGISASGPPDLDAILPSFPVDLLQAPFNVVDRRLLTSGWMARIDEANIELHIRSVFLQGLLLMDGSNRPSQFDRWKPLWEKWQSWLVQTSVTPLEACLSFAMAQREVRRVVVGVDGSHQLSSILDAVEALTPTPPDTIRSEDPDLIDPSRWSTP